MRRSATRVREERRPRTVAAVLLDRRAVIALPGAEGTSAEDTDGEGVGVSRGADPGPVPDPMALAPVVPDPVVPDPMVPDPVVAAGVALFEADLLERGYLAAPALVRHLHRLDTDTLTTHGGLLLTDLDAVLGADRPHVPLFRGFPRSTPKNTRALFVDRILALITQRPEQPCVLCGQLGTVSALSPCGHLVCRQCFDGADYSACPICRERIDVDDPFLRPTPRLSQESTRALPDRARMLTASADPRAEAHAELASLLARTAAPTPQDLDDLSVLLGTRSRTELGWVPEQLPSREVKAVVLAWLLDDPDTRAVTLPEVTTRLDTATDVLRVLAVRSGGDPGLTSVPRLAAVPRPVRRALLAALDRVPPATLVEDLGRHRTLWVHAAERLHPFEYARRFPTAAAAFAVLRRTPLPRTGPVAEAVAAAGFPVSGGRATSYGFGHAVEQALAAPDVPEAVRLLTGRPGEFLRRLDHLLRVGVAADRAGAPGTGSEGGTSAPGDTREPGDAPAAADAPGGGTPQGTGPAVAAVLSALPAALPAAAPAVLVSALGALRVRGIRHPYRVFFPAGRTANTHVIPDDRPALPVPLITRVTELLIGELLRRAAQLPSVHTAVIDTALDDITAPFAERTASRALVTLPRGSVLPLPEDRRLRLFLHWTEAADRVDLDLSLGFFNESWQHIGTCDYTNMRFGGTAAVHSGDLTSAPPPLGASEFVDIDLDALAALGVRYVAACVYSFNSVAFEDIPEAFAGYMLRADLPEVGPAFDPRSVEQRFDLTGGNQGAFPLAIDVAGSRMRWYDLAQKLTGTAHAVHVHAERIAALTRSLETYFASGARVGLGEAARWQAAARAGTVLLRDRDGSVRRFVRVPGEDVRDFLRRLSAGNGDGDGNGDDGRSGPAAHEADLVGAVDPVGVVELAFLNRGDHPVADGAEVYALHPGALAADRVRLLAAAEVTGMLAPTGPLPGTKGTPTGTGEGPASR